MKQRRKDIADHPAQPLTDLEKASVWALYEETGRVRGTARELGLALSTVQRVLAGDPLRVQSIKISRQEERSARWIRIEEQSLDDLEETLRLARDARRKLAGDGRRKAPARLTEAERDALALTPRHLTALRMVADSATTKANLLQGDPTDSIRHNLTAANELTPAQAAKLAKELGLEALIPPAIREMIADDEAIPRD